MRQTQVFMCNTSKAQSMRLTVWRLFDIVSSVISHCISPENGSSSVKPLPGQRPSTHSNLYASLYFGESHRRCSAFVGMNNKSQGASRGVVVQSDRDNWTTRRPKHIFTMPVTTVVLGERLGRGWSESQSEPYPYVSCIVLLRMFVSLLRGASLD